MSRLTSGWNEYKKGALFFQITSDPVRAIFGEAYSKITNTMTSRMDLSRVGGRTSGRRVYGRKVFNWR